MGTVEDAERFKDFTNSSYVKLLFKFRVDEDEILTYVEVEMSDAFIDALRANRVRLLDFKVVGE